MKRLAFALGVVCLIGSSAHAATLLWQNTCPPVAVTDPAYTTGIQNIANAVNAGSIIHVSLKYSENGGSSTFFTEVTAVRVAVNQTQAGQYANYASGVLVLMPPINSQDQAIAGTSPTETSVDTFGNYFYGMVGKPIGQYSCYLTSWWAN
jgi:hypothetical protein